MYYSPGPGNITFTRGSSVLVDFLIELLNLVYKIYDEFVLNYFLSLKKTTYFLIFIY